MCTDGLGKRLSSGQDGPPGWQAALIWGSCYSKQASPAMRAMDKRQTRLHAATVLHCTAKELVLENLNIFYFDQYRHNHYNITIIIQSCSDRLTSPAKTGPDRRAGTVEIGSQT